MPGDPVEWVEKQLYATLPPDRSAFGDRSREELVRMVRAIGEERMDPERLACRIVEGILDDGDDLRG